MEAQATMTEEERDELLRWAAALQGYANQIGPCPPGGSRVIHGGCEHNLWWERAWDDDYDEDDVLLPCMLTGWPGFGLAVEAARERGYDWSVQGFGKYREDEATGITVYLSGTPPLACAPWEGEDDDPGIAAWLALREALR